MAKKSVKKQQKQQKQKQRQKQSVVVNITNQTKKVGRKSQPRQAPQPVVHVAKISTMIVERPSKTVTPVAPATPVVPPVARVPVVAPVAPVAASVPVAPRISTSVAETQTIPANTLLNSLRPIRNVYAPTDNNQFLTSITDRQERIKAHDKQKMEEKKSKLQTENPMYVNIRPVKKELQTENPMYVNIRPKIYQKPAEPAKIKPLLETSKIINENDTYEKPKLYTSKIINEKEIDKENAVKNMMNEKIKENVFGKMKEQFYLGDNTNNENVFDNNDYEQPKQIDNFESSDEYKTNELIPQHLQREPVEILPIPQLQNVSSVETELFPENDRSRRRDETKKQTDKKRELQQQYNKLYDDMDIKTRIEYNNQYGGKSTQTNTKSQGAWRSKIKELNDFIWK